MAAPRCDIRLFRRVLAVVAASVLLGSCGGQAPPLTGASRPPATSSPVSASPVTPLVTTSPTRAASLSRHPALLDASEVGPDWTQDDTYEAGALPYNDALCGTHYPSMELLDDSIGKSFTEVGPDTVGVTVRLFYARYASPEAAGTAYQELDRATADCPLGLTDSPERKGLPLERVGGRGTLAYSIDGGDRGLSVQEIQQAGCVLLVAVTSSLPSAKIALPVVDVVVAQARVKLEQNPGGEDPLC